MLRPRFFIEGRAIFVFMRDVAAAPASLSFSLHVDAPIWRVYRNWKRLERFPAFLPSVREARWLAKDRLYWREEYGGTEYETTFRIVTDERANTLTWQSLTGPDNSGSALCEAQQGGGTLITLTIRYSPDTLFQAAEAIGARHRRYLQSFRAFVEGTVGEQGKKRTVPAR
jgi:uncharacterized membrane protein